MLFPLEFAALSLISKLIVSSLFLSGVFDLC